AYLFMPIRAHLDPYLNEGNPTTWPALRDVLPRAQFGNPSLFDNPMYPAGGMNPGRSLLLVGQQLLNYMQYFTWQWGHDWPAPVQQLLAIGFAGLGLLGARRHWRADRTSAATMTALIGTLTLLLVFYLNFKWGYSQPYNTPGLAHEVRERDYFFIVSFSAWGVWVGIGLVSLGEWITRALEHAPARSTPGPGRWPVPLPVLLLALIALAGPRASAPPAGTGSLGGCRSGAAPGADSPGGKPRQRVAPGGNPRPRLRSRRAAVGRSLRRHRHGRGQRHLPAVVRPGSRRRAARC